jgi:hypothetical protein
VIGRPIWFLPKLVEGTDACVTKVNHVSAIVIRLTLDNQLTGNEFLGKGGLFFNIDPVISLNEIEWAAGGPFDASIDFGTGAYKADEDGFFGCLSALSPRAVRRGRGPVVGATAVY